MESETNLWWVRHAPTRAPYLAGWTDIDADLSDTHALRTTSRALPAEAPVISSDLRRAIQTADAIADGRQRLPHADALREFNFGLWEGMAMEEIDRRYPEISRKFWTDPGSVKPPEGEGWEELAARVSEFVDGLARCERRSDYILVAHFGTILTQIQRATGLAPMELAAYHIKNLSITRLKWSSGDIQAGDLAQHL